MKKNIEAIYPLSPSQQGMLFETLAMPGAGLYIEQSLWQLRGTLQIATFQAAWQQVIARHASLRTCFIWQDQKEPLQVVLHNVTTPLNVLDWREIPPNHQPEQLDTLINTIRREGFQLSRAPLLHVALIHISDDRYQVLLTFHHIIMDGWGLPLLVREVLQTYNASRQGQDAALPPAPPYVEYIRWLKRQDVAQAEAFWRTTLHGVLEPTPLGKFVDGGSAGFQPALSASMDAGDPGRHTPGYEERQTILPAAETARLVHLAQQQRVTLNNIVQTVWALLLACYSGRDDVIFGVTVAGRPPEIKNVETMLGLFINTVPLRVQAAPDVPFWAWVHDLRDKQTPQQAYEYCSAGQIRQWSDMPGRLSLYDSILVFENYPLDAAALAAADFTLELDAAQIFGAQTRYPLTLLALPGTTLTLKGVFQRPYFDPADMTRIMEHFSILLHALVQTPDLPVRALQQHIPPEQIPTIHGISPIHEEKREFSLPRTPTECEVAEIWKNLLGAAEVSVSDNFFDLGGHSLLAMQLLGRIRQTFGVELPLQDLFTQPTLAHIAELIDALRWVQTPQPHRINGDEREEGVL